jgi:hypothetical protein
MPPAIPISHMPDGRDPDRVETPKKLNLDKLSRFTSSRGNVPVKKLSAPSNIVRAVSLPNSEGRVPLKPLSDTKSCP